MSRRTDTVTSSDARSAVSGLVSCRGVLISCSAKAALNLAYHGVRARDQSFNVTLERDFTAQLAPIVLTPQDISRVMLNLIGNGFDAVNKRAKAEPGHAPTLKVSTRDLGDSVEIRLWDNGTGIPRDVRDELFDPFLTTKPTGEGTSDMPRAISASVLLRRRRDCDRASDPAPRSVPETKVGGAVNP